MQLPQKILVGDSHPLIRAGLRDILSSASNLLLVGEVTDARELLCQATNLCPDILVLDLDLPGLDLSALVENLQDAGSQAKVVVLSDCDDVQMVQEAVKAGVSGYILKDESPQVLLDALTTLARGNNWYSPQIMHKLAEHDFLWQQPDLTDPTGGRNYLGKRLLYPALAVGITLMLAGCGALPQFEPTPMPATIRPEGILQFEPYTHQERGYTLSVPMDAQITDEDGGLTRIEYENEQVIGGSHLQLVEVIDAPESPYASEILGELMSQEREPEKFEISHRNEALQSQEIDVAAASYAIEPGVHCPERRAVAAVYVAEGRAYVLRILSDAPDRCDAGDWTSLSESSKIVGSFRLAD